jgi:cyclase
MDIRDGRVVKGVRFEGMRDMDDPFALARYYNESGADELVFYDITASLENRDIIAGILGRVAREVTIPLTVGGNIRSLDDFERVIGMGAVKVSINTGAIADPGLIKKAADAFGSARVVLAMDVKRAHGEFRVFTKGGREDAGIGALYWARFGEDAGAGELVINSIDTDGVRSGFDTEMTRAICDCVSIPVVASGGAGNREHFLELFREVPKAAAGLAASIFHSKEVNIPDLKKYLLGHGVDVRL